mmetsp:Transcript_44433/g.117464  ORF Transcript_44433/g.117464 Transcript_44433/m.117464 type:complete len:257 (-) Transcript_44433:581-1351(-)
MHVEDQVVGDGAGFVKGDGAKLLNIFQGRILLDGDLPVRCCEHHDEQNMQQHKFQPRNHRGHRDNGCQEVKAELPHHIPGGCSWWRGWRRRTFRRHLDHGGCHRNAETQSGNQDDSQGIGDQDRRIQERRPRPPHCPLRAHELDNLGFDHALRAGHLHVRAEHVSGAEGAGDVLARPVSLVPVSGSAGVLGQGARRSSAGNATIHGLWLLLNVVDPCQHRHHPHDSRGQIAEPHTDGIAKTNLIRTYCLRLLVLPV